MQEKRISRDQIQKFRLEGWTFQQIGEFYGVKRQRIHAVYTGYYKKYRKTDKYRMYRRHWLTHGLDGVRPYKPCTYCNLSIRFTTA